MNNVLVLDADRHGDGDGVANLLALFERHHFDLEAIPIVSTPNGGFHTHFRRPDELGLTKARLCDAVDVRDNAYVIAPGCALVVGRAYKLVEGTLEQFAAAIAQRSIPLPPDWLIHMLVRQPTPRSYETAGPIDDETARKQDRVPAFEHPVSPSTPPRLGASPVDGGLAVIQAASDKISSGKRKRSRV